MPYDGHAAATSVSASVFVLALEFVRGMVGIIVRWFAPPPLSRPVSRLGLTDVASPSLTARSLRKNKLRTLTDRRYVRHPGGDHGAVPDIERDQCAGKGKGAADQGGPEDDGPHGRGAYRLVDIPLRVHILLHFRPHGAGFGVRL